MKIFLLILIIGLSSCQTAPPKVPVEQQPGVTEKAYKNIKRNIVLNNAEKVLALADKGDFNFFSTATGFKATRKWFSWSYLGGLNFGVDTWVFEASDTKSGALAVVKPFRSYGYSNYNKDQDHDELVELRSARLLDLFWKRLDYLLGLNHQWTSCDDEWGDLKTLSEQGTISGLCDFSTMTEDYPENLAEADIERIFEKKYKYYRYWSYMKKLNSEKWTKQAEKDPSIKFRDR